jgi:hypothetical protein
MAAIFLVLAVIVGVVVGDAVLTSTGPGSVEVFTRSTTQFNQGQLLLTAAGLGLIFAVFLLMAWGASSNRRAKRREHKLVRRDLESRVHELEDENTQLREQLDRSTRTNRLSDLGTEAGTQVSEPVAPVGRRSSGSGGTIRDRLQRGDRVEEPARSPRAES